MKKTISLFLLMGGFFFSSWDISAQNKISLPDMDLSLAYQQYGSPMKNAAVTGEKLTVGGEHFGQGVGVQANSKIKLSLRKNTGLFTCKVGVNDRSLDYKKDDFSKIPMTDGTMLFYRTDGTGGKKQFVGVGDGDGSFDKGSVFHPDNASRYRWLPDPLFHPGCSGNRWLCRQMRITGR